ncbi:MAG: crossover junction endodeoxyribonuclease RuvC [Alphaproteobacteria bacterium]
MLILGLDPGLRNTGWGLVYSEGNRLKHVANGEVHSDAKADIATRLVQLHDGLQEVVREYQPQTAAVEETFSNSNAKSSLMLGLARGVVILVPALYGIDVANYPPNKVKKAVVGAGKADKAQVQLMVQRLLPGVDFGSADAADALAVAICHAHLRVTEAKWNSFKKA